MKVVINGEKEYQAERIGISSNKVYIKCPDEDNFGLSVMIDSDIFEVRGNERTLYIDCDERVL